MEKENGNLNADQKQSASSGNMSTEAAGNV
jgi:hypothetical protein